MVAAVLVPQPVDRSRSSELASVLPVVTVRRVRAPFPRAVVAAVPEPSARREVRMAPATVVTEETAQRARSPVSRLPMQVAAVAV